MIYSWFLGRLSIVLFALGDRVTEWACALARRVITDEDLRRDDEMLAEMMQEKVTDTEPKV